MRSKLLYNSPLWRPQFIKDIIVFEQIQRRATKYILNDYTSPYKERLISLNLLPIMMQFELNDIMFFINCLKHPTKAFNVYEYVSLSSHTTSSSTTLKLTHAITRTNTERHLNMSLSSIKKALKHFLWQEFIQKLSSDNPCTFHFVCPCAKCLHSPIMCNFMR